MKEGLAGGFYSVLSQSDVERIHRASVSILQDVGMLCETDLALEVFTRAGASVDRESHIVRLPAQLLETSLASAPKTAVLFGRDHQFDIRLESGRVHYGMGGTSEPYIWDFDLQGPRPPSKADMVSCTRLGHALPNIDFIMALCSAGDVAYGQHYFHEYDAILRNTSKPVVVSVQGRRLTARFLEMAAAAAGGEEKLRKEPCVAAYSSPVTPLRFTRYNDGMVEAAALGVPIICAGGAMVGATSPATLAGSISLIDAEALFGVVFAQIVKPGCPVIFAPQTNVMDMVTAQATFGSPEQSLARAAAVQMARFYGLPTFATGGGSDAKLPDGQAAAEATLGMMINAMSGQTLTQNLGTLASGLYGAPEMLVICDEIVHMIKCVFGGLKVTDDTLALDVIKEVGPGGDFLNHEHTASSFRTSLFFPAYFPRLSVERWKERGRMSITEVAHTTVATILADAGPVRLPPGADSALERALEAAIAESDAIVD